MRVFGTVAMGIRTPVIKKNDNLVKIVVDSVMKAHKSKQLEIRNRDVIGITEAVVAIVEGNYATVDQIAEDIKRKYPGGVLGVVFPTPVSRNRFSLILKGIARASKKIYLQMHYPNDEVGNSLFNPDLVEENGLNPYSDVLDLVKYKELFGKEKHLYTGVNYIEYFQELVESENCEVEFVFANDQKVILDYTKNVLVASVHNRDKLKRFYKDKTDVVYGIDDILKVSVNGSGYNSRYGLLGSNKATEEQVKLFPEHGEKTILEIKKKIFDLVKKKVEVLIYGDGAFKDPIGGIWELADPVVSPFFTDGLVGTPNELKLKYLSDNKYTDLKGNELTKAIKQEIKNKEKDLKGNMLSQGTTPRQFTDLLGSLCDLISGSGDKGTPVVYIQGYFDNYAD